MYTPNETHKCSHCGRDVARRHDRIGKKTVVVPVRGASITKMDASVEWRSAMTAYDESYHIMNTKVQVKCGRQTCGKHTTFDVAISTY